ncbi:AT-rich interactive domain-containing protein 4B-like isoform X2 [Mercenaria mercenaria]|uniref:AT-rich interactive domain-containing protein 4B-like isoform X2 n=1 Tax=Mercenaria mercenaria TaxID=6596 RepID=UPI00234EF086|nr:AT-rich interactive domain-containing protein 4B-like isoform X2 [Mercenaria mercenaria]
MMAASSEPPYLPIGTDVSAKYRGAFCEAKVKKIVKSVKCRVFLKETQSSLLITDEYITGPLQMGATVEVKHPDTGRVMEATIKQMSDSSMYTVVFDDADERTLRRTQLCLKGDKHFMESETLDNLPLSNPEHFGTPVIARGKRGRSGLGTGSSHEDSDSSSEEDDSPRKKYRGKNQELVGKIMFYETGDRKKTQTVPALVVLPDANPIELKNKDHVLIRSFKDGKFMSVARKELSNFARETVLKSEDKSLKPAMEKALLYIDNRELPATWNKEEMLGSDDDEGDEEEDTSDDDEISEEKDRFVAQLYKFSDDRGTPINKGPSLGTKDLNLYKLFKVVQKYGGYNRVTNQMKWRLVYSKMQLPPSNTASTQIKNAYKKYLHAFEDFYRKLGSSMGTISRPSRSRNDSGRSILSFRGREAARTPDKTESEREKVSEDTKSEFDSDAESVAKLGTPKRPKSARMKTDVLKETKKVEAKEKETKEDKKMEKQETKKDDKKESKKAEESPKKTVAKKTEEKKENKQQEVEKKGAKKKEDGSAKEKSDTEEELKDLQKKIGRRRSMKTEEKAEDDKEDSKKDKKEEQKEKEQKDKKDDGETDKKKEEEKTEKKPKKKKNGKSEESSDMETESVAASVSNTDTSNLPAGAKLRVRYGKGKNTREYEAKILEVSSDPGPAQYLVHYQGWNTRHDEWVGRDRIMKVLERPDSIKSKKPVQKPSPKPGIKGPKKKSLLDKAPASPSSVKSDSSTSQGPGRPANKAGKSTSSASSSPSVTTSAKPRPTRSNSIELITDGLPAKRRKRKVSSVYDSTNGSDSEESGKSDTEMDTSEVDRKNEKSKTDSPIKSSSMPFIASEKSEEDITEDLDSSIDRSPPKLMKQVDIGKETVETEEKLSEKEQTKEEPLAPVLNVVEMEKNNEPILEKLEAQLNSTCPEKVEKPTENKEKETKKKEPERRGRKPLVKSVVKVDKNVEPEIVKKEDKEEIVVEKETVKVQESLYDFKDEPENDTEIKLCRKKAFESNSVKDDQKDIVKPEIVKEVKNVLQGSVDDSGKEFAGHTPPHLLDEKDTAKSDSEVERRGRKKKILTVKETVKELKTPVPTVSVNSIEALISSGPPEKKPFITLAEKKQGFSPMVRKIPVAVERPDIESAKLLLQVSEVDKIERKEEVKKMPDLLVVHKASPVKTDIVLGRKVETGEQEEINGDIQPNDEVKEEENEVPSVKKKVRKKTKKKLEMEEQEMVAIRKTSKRGPGRRSKELINKEKDLESASASKDNSVDIDLRCEEQIRSRSASPETVSGKSFVQESQGFVPRIETIDCRISDSQGSDSFSLKHDKTEKSHSMNKGNLFENTPPTTPEHDSDDAVQQHGHNDQIKTAGKLSDEGGSKTDSSQAAGSESPVGNASPSNRSTGSSSGVIAGSEGSIDVPVYSTKRRRESDEPTPTKRRKRACRGKSTSSRTKQLADSDSEDFSKGRSPQYSSDSYQRTASSANRSPRPPKYNFNLEEGKYLEGTDRISFLVDKITEIRKIYMNLKSEVACIDRRRKKLRRKEREREAQSSSAVEVECS